MAPPNISGPRPQLPRPLPQTTGTTQKERPPQGTSTPAPSQPARPTPSFARKDVFDSSTPPGRAPPPRSPLLSPLLSRPLPSDELLAGMERRSKARPPESLPLPANANESVTVANVPLPTADSKPTPAQAHMTQAAQMLGFSPEVSAMATAEMARRLGKNLVIDLKTKQPLVAAEDFKKFAGDAPTMPFTFDPSGVAVLKDANLTASLGMESLEQLYAQQGTLLPSLRDAAVVGADIDFNQELKLVNDPATREGMMAYYEAMRTTRDLGHGNDSAFDALPATKARLDKALKSLPEGSPLKGQFQAMSTELANAQTTLLAGTERGGQTPRAAIALMNNITNAPLGRLPDEEVVAGSIDGIADAAALKGATPKQVDALRGALETAYGLRSQGGSTPALLAANKQKLAQQVRDAGPFASPMKSLFERVGKEATLRPQDVTAQPMTTGDLASDAATISGIAAQLKLLAKGADIKGLPDALDALKGAADSIANGNTREGIIAGISAGPALVSGVFELLQKMPGLQPQALELLKRVNVVFKGPTDLIGMYGNAKKVVYGTDLDGKQVSSGERINAAADLALDNVPNLITAVETVTGASGTLTEIAAAPPLLIPLVQIKLMTQVLEQAAQMKGNLAMHDVRKRFNLGNGDDAQYTRALDGQLKEISSKPTTRWDQAMRTSQELLTGQFKNTDTAARFQAYASSKLLGGRQTVQSLMRGQRPAVFLDQTSPDVRGKEGADLSATARQLQKLAAEFYSNEFNDARSIVSVSNGARSGESYMKTPEQRRELDYWLKRR